MLLSLQVALVHQKASPVSPIPPSSTATTPPPLSASSAVPRRSSRLSFRKHYVYASGDFDTEDISGEESENEWERVMGDNTDEDEDTEEDPGHPPLL